MMTKNNTPPENLYDAVIIGGGPAGLTAAVYLARARYRVVVLEKEQFGGQITITDEVVNYPGIMKTSGKELTETMFNQGKYFGAEFVKAKATGIVTDGDIKTVRTSAGDFHCFAVIVCTGAHPRTIGFKGETEYKGRGVAYCATCDGEFFTGKEIFVIGGGYAAAEESVFLTKFASHVTVIMRSDDFSCAAAVSREAKDNPKIEILTNTVVEEVAGDNGLNYIRWKNTKSGDITEYRAENGNFFGVFVFAGYSPDTEIVKNTVKTDEHGYIITDASQQTSLDGIYAAGDVCIKALRQVVTATGDGALAATQAEKYVAEMQRKTGFCPQKPKTQTENSENARKVPPPNETNGDIFDRETKNQLKELFAKFDKSLILKVCTDSRPISEEALLFTNELCSVTDKLRFEVTTSNNPQEYAPCIKILTETSEETGLAFHGVPGGHEFTSFILALYNIACSDSKVEEDILKEINEISEKTDLKILVTLSCGMCPDLVTACQHIAARNKNVTAQVYDINHFESLRKHYNVMSVPCLVINDTAVSFGKKGIAEVLLLIKKFHANA